MAAKKTKEEIHNLPPEILLEIRSRLPIKDVFKYRSVCKSWNLIPDFISCKIRQQPLCGLILRDTSFELATQSNSPITYLSKGAIQSIPITTEISINKPLPVSSGFDTGYMRDIFFEFGPLSALRQGQFFTVDNGLILIWHNDGTYHVYNPTTKQVLDLPMTPHWKKRAIPRLRKSAFILNCCPIQYDVSFSFIVMRVIPRARSAEIYSSKFCKWSLYKLITHFDDDHEVLKSNWCFENYVFVIRTRTLFFLTDKDQGLAMVYDKEKFWGRFRRTLRVYKLPLPKVVKGGFRNARLGEHRECLYLSYYDDDGGVRFWKRNCEILPYSNRWVPLLEIGKTPRLSTSLECKHNPLFKLLKEGNSIIPIGFYPRHAIALLRVKSTIFTYDLLEKKLDKFAEISDKDFKLSAIVLPYIPFVVPFVVSGKPGELEPVTVGAYLDKIG